MDLHVKEYFCQFSPSTPNGHFYRVIPLHETPDIHWDQISQVMPGLNRGWYELSQLNSQDRIEFVRDYWLNKLPFCPKLNESVMQFFDSLDDIGIYLTQQIFDSPFKAYMVYSLKDNGGFFRGELGATEEEIRHLKTLFPDYNLPRDYAAFLQIHNGFSKSTDQGIVSSDRMEEVYWKFQGLLSEQKDPLKTAKKKFVDPQSLIPFYESFNLPCYQCFWAEWYPAEEMGILYSGFTIDVRDTSINEALRKIFLFPHLMNGLCFIWKKSNNLLYP